MTDEMFKPGDQVRLKTGGPLMTVVRGTSGGLQCSWFDGGDLHRDVFQLEELVRDHRGRPPK